MPAARNKSRNDQPLTAEHHQGSRGLQELSRAGLFGGLLPEGLGVAPDRGVVYVGNSGESTVSLIEGAKFTVFATLVVGPAPKAAAVDPATGFVYVPTLGDDQVRVVRP